MGRISVERDGSLSAHPRQDDGEEQAKSDIFHVLSNARRRRVLRYLLEQPDRTATKRELSAHLAGIEYGVPAEAVSSEQRRRVYIALHQTHLPKLVNSGFAEFGAGDNVVTLTDRVDEIRDYLARTDPHGTDWGRLYLGVGLFGLGLVTSALVEALPLSVVPTVAWMALIAVAVTVAGVVHYVTASDTGVDAIAVENSAGN